MKRTPLRSKSLVKRKKCANCSKNRKIEFYDTPRSRYCKACKISISFGKKKEAKKHTKKYWIKKLDKLVGDVVRSRRTCESWRDEHTTVLQWAHIISRRYHHTRWLEENALCLCSGCHKFYTDRPLEWEEFITSKFGDTHYRWLKQLALSNEKIDYEELYNELLTRYTSTTEVK